MPIKKRSNLPIPGDEPESTGLNIVASEKKPIPEGGKVRDVYGEEATPKQKRRLGPVAIDCKASPPDRDLTIEDRVLLMRSPYDKNNPQEARYRNRVRNRGTAITAFCITCLGGRKDVTECIDTTCPLWAFRLGSDPFYGRRG